MAEWKSQHFSSLPSSAPASKVYLTGLLDYLKFKKIHFTSIVNLQCCVDFGYTAVGIQLYVYIHSFSYAFSLWFIAECWV